MYSSESEDILAEAFSFQNSRTTVSSPAKFFPFRYRSLCYDVCAYLNHNSSSCRACFWNEGYHREALRRGYNFLAPKRNIHVDKILLPPEIRSLDLTNLIRVKCIDTSNFPELSAEKDYYNHWRDNDYCWIFSEKEFLGAFYPKRFEGVGHFK